ncbi:DUF2505 family protein [Pseudenhygromyxa sp. WMMC2535]|uniref:DUF2505 family protein n=1 Tax=Pseudenhygromyxa sp. WMMC2535 TaxID=2712867 RepID=UPI0015562654|nr:DUF2505 family protein [Pseudenhygromyxa sp. WMMC2535]NVB37053.1 DUF2505 family protein [Pseudenhygromyxa sp. WMMC2535]
MRECDITHEVRCTPERFWPLYFDADFNRETFLHGLRWDEPTITEFREDEREIIRNIAAHPKLEVGGKVAKLIGERLGYQEWGRFDKATQIFHFRHRTTVFGDRLWIRGRMWTEPLGEDRMRWHSALTIECKILGVGGLLERAVEHNIYKSWPLCSNYWNQWFPAHPEAS